MHSDGGAFPSTRWTLIRSAKSSPEARRTAVAELMRTYWRPLYVYLRHKGLDPAAAQDAVQEVLILLIERDVIAKVDPARGRLRAYLKTVAANHLANAYEKATAKKRGGEAALVPLELETAERLVQPGSAPDRAFDEQWAAAVMERAMKRLEAEYRSGDRAGQYRHWARRLASPALRPLARNLFEFVSSNRRHVSTWFGMQPERDIAASLRERYGDPEAPKCSGEACQT